jgi:hypothetical protein
MVRAHTFVPEAVFEVSSIDRHLIQINTTQRLRRSLVPGLFYMDKVRKIFKNQIE